MALDHSTLGRYFVEWNRKAKKDYCGIVGTVADCTFIAPLFIVRKRDNHPTTAKLRGDISLHCAGFSTTCFS